MLTVDLGLFLQITRFILNIIRQLPIIVGIKPLENVNFKGGKNFVVY